MKIGVQARKARCETWSDEQVNPLTRGTGEFRGGGRGAGRSARLCAIGVLGAALAFAAAVAATGLASSGDQRPEDSVASKRLLASYTLTQPKGPRIDAKWFGTRTAISWSTGSSHSGSLYLSAAGKRERLFGRGRVGSQRVRWIAPGVRYVFHLYAGSSKRRVLTSFTLSLPKRPRIDAKWFGVSTAISWRTGSGRPGSLYFSEGGKPERLFARGSRGSQRVSWIQPGIRYVFHLYAGRSKKRLLTSYTLLQPKRPRIGTAWFGAITTISWSTGSRRAGSLYVSQDGGRLRLLARGTRNSLRVRWITPGTRYVFKLYDAPISSPA